MIRTQVYLPKQLYKQIEVVASKEKKPKAQIIRELLDRELRKRIGKQSAQEAFNELVKIAVSGPGDLSTRHDEYLYGDKK